MRTLNLHFLRNSLRAVGPTLSANLFNQAVILFAQLLIVPVLLGSWGVSGYGNWVLLSAIPTYLSISDFGFTSSAKTDMAVRATRGDHHGARVTISSVGGLLLPGLTVIGIVYAAVAFSVDWAKLLNLSGIDNYEAVGVLLWGLLQVASYQIFLLGAAVVRAAKRPASEVMANAVFRIVETAALLGTALLGGDIVVCAFSWAASRALTTMIFWLVLSRLYPSLMPSFKLIDLHRVRDLLTPSISYMLLPLANAIAIQGTVIILGVMTTPLIVAGYNTTRIVTRLGVSAASVLNFAFGPQYSFAIGRLDADQFYGMVKTHALIIVAAIIPYLAVMAVLGSWFVSLLSHGNVQADPIVLALLAIAAAQEMLWGIAPSIGSSINHVGALSVAFLAVATAGALLTAAGITTWGLPGAALALVGTHFVMLLYTLYWYRRERVALNKILSSGANTASVSIPQPSPGPVG